MDTPEAIPPQDNSAEFNFLVTLLRNPKEAGEAFLLIQPDDFHLGGHRAIYTVAQEMVHQGLTLDPATLAGRLTSKKLLEKAGGKVFMDMLARSVAGPELREKREESAQRIRNAAALRQTIALAVGLIRRSFKPYCEAQGLLQEAEARIKEIRAHLTPDKTEGKAS